MKHSLLYTFLILAPSMTALADAPGGGTGGMGIVVNNSQKALSLTYIGQYGELDLVKANPITFNLLGKLKNPNVTIQAQDRVIHGEITKPDFVDAISIITEDGKSVVIINEKDVSEEKATDNSK
ncbi:MAG: hypothetical protein EOP04_16400 [Proteobacteria bacterium]|nr:MAG: hypothetical protein EOP04_16400 [Pseudomonadota bacterium]